MKVLFVDDNDQLRLLFETVGKYRDDIEVVTARNGVVAMNMDLTDFDAVVCDQMMPDMTGVELAAELRDQYPSMVIILFTASGVAARDVPQGAQEDVTLVLVKGAENSVFEVIDRIAQLVAKP